MTRKSNGARLTHIWVDKSHKLNIRNLVLRSANKNVKIVSMNTYQPHCTALPLLFNDFIFKTKASFIYAVLVLRVEILYPCHLDLLRGENMLLNEKLVFSRKVGHLTAATMG